MNGNLKIRVYLSNRTTPVDRSGYCPHFKIIDIIGRSEASKKKNNNSNEVVLKTM